MIRNLKATGLALVAVLALSALTASSASAVTDHFTTTKDSALLTGVSHDNSFHFPGGSPSFKCTTSQFTGTVLNNATEATIDPTYTGEINETPHNTAHRCTGTGGDVVIDMNGCHYVLTGNTTGHDPVGTPDATVWITCPAGQVIKVTQPGTGITIQVPPQTPTTGGVTYLNKPLHSGGNSVEVTATATGITTLCHPAFTCGLAGIATHANSSTYTGTVLATGYEDLDGLPTPITEGAQIPISFSSTP